MKISKSVIGGLIWLVLIVQVGAEPRVDGRVRLASGEPAAGVQVRLFDLTDLRQWVGATTDAAGYFALPLRALPGAAAAPEHFELGLNYPNPFNPSTIIPYQLAAATQVRLEVFNVLGQRVATLVDGEQAAGFHTASWDGTDAAGRAVAAGVYLYRLQGDGVHLTRRMVLVDGQAGRPAVSAGGSVAVSAGGPAGADLPETAPVYGLTVSGEDLETYVDPAFRLEAGRGPLDLVVKARVDAPPAKVATEGPGALSGDVNNDGQVTLADALVVVIHHLAPTIAAPNHGDISLGDVNGDGRIDLTDALLIMTYSVNPDDPTLPAGIGDPVQEEDLRYPEATAVIDGVMPAGLFSTSVPGALAAGATAYYRVTVSGPGTLVAYTTGGTDTYGSVEDNAGTVLAANDDAVRGNRNFRVSTVLSRAGTYYVRVRGFIPSISGDYTLHVEVEEEPDDRAALVALYEATDGANWADNSNWLSDAPLGDWRGVATNADGRVTSVDLSSNQLSGSIPAALARLTRLELLNLSSNQLSGSIPAALGELTKLQELDLSSNQLDGSIPAALGELTNLKGLSLSRNQLGGSIPVELGELTKLQRLDLFDNQLSGSIPAALGELTNLKGLSLSRNQLGGSIPVELGELTNLKILALHSNELSGSIPVELGELTNLVWLNLRGNELGGSIPVELGELTNLEVLALHVNELSGSIPAALGELTNLVWLNLRGNELGGSIPAALGELTNLVYLNLRENQLSGCIPEGLRAVAENDLDQLGLSSCP